MRRPIGPRAAGHRTRGAGIVGLPPPTSGAHCGVPGETDRPGRRVRAPGTPRLVAVVGAGIVGVSTAIWLRRAGHEVVLIDREGPAAGASRGNGGVLASCAVVPVTTPGLLRRAPRMLLDPRGPLFLRWGYLPRLAPWLRRYLAHANAYDAECAAAALTPLIGDSLEAHRALAEGTGAERRVVPSDYHFLYASRAGFEADRFAWGLRRAHGFRWEEVDDARACDPALGGGFAVRLGGHGRIDDPGAYVEALAAHLEATGGRLLRAEVEGLVAEGGRVTGVRASGGTIACDAAVIATGAWSKGLAAAMGVDVPLESERGYHLELWEPSVMPRAPVMLSAAKVVATPMEGRLRLAGVVELGGLDAPPSRAPFALLRRAARAAMPGLAWAQETEWMGHRPAPADSIPVIGEAPGLRGAWMGFGHHHVGLTGGPATGRLLAGMISGATPNVDVAPYSPSRFVRA